MGLTLQQRFGSNAIIDESNADNPKLVISLNDLKQYPAGNLLSGGMDTAVTANNANNMADKIFAALFLLSRQNQPTNTSALVGAVIGNSSSKQVIEREGISQIMFSYDVKFYIPDTIGSFTVGSMV